MMVHESKCYDFCPDGYYNSDSGGKFTCKLCPEHCETCASQKECLTCSQDFYINPKNNLCEICDTPNQFYIQGITCLECYFRCQTCSGSKKTECLSCSLPATFTEYGTCREEPDPKLEVKKSSFNNIKQIVTVQYNLRLVKNNCETSFKPVVIQDFLPVNFTGKYVKVDHLKFEYEMEFFERVTNATITFINENFTLTQSQSGEENYFFDNITVNNINNNYQALQLDAKAVKSTSTMVVKIVTILMMVVGFSSAVALIKLFQMIDYYTFINVKHPKNFLMVVSILSNNVLNDVPNFFHVLVDDNCRPIEQVFIDNDMDCQFFGNSGPIFLILFFFLLLKFVLKMYSWRTTNGDRLWPY